MRLVGSITALSLFATSITPALAASRAPSFTDQVMATYSGFHSTGEALRTYSNSTTDINYFNKNFKDLKNEKPLKPAIENGAFVFREKGAVNRVLVNQTPGLLKINGQDWRMDPKASLEKNLAAIAMRLHISTASLFDYLIPRAEAVDPEKVFTAIKYTLTGTWLLGWAGVVVGMGMAGKSTGDPDASGYMAAVGIMIGWAWPIALIAGLKEGHSAELPLAFPVEASCKPQLRVKARSLRGDEQVLTYDQNAKPPTLKIESKVDGKETGISGTMKHGLTSPYDKILGPFVENCAKGAVGEKEIRKVLAANQARFKTDDKAVKDADVPSEKDLSNTDAN